MKRFEGKIINKLLIKTLVFLSLTSWSYSQGFSPDHWKYIAVDSTRQKWGDWKDPDWLRYFGLDFADVNRDGLMDIISDRYIYHNPGGYIIHIEIERKVVHGVPRLGGVNPD